MLLFFLSFLVVVFSSSSFEEDEGDVDEEGDEEGDGDGDEEGDGDGDGLIPINESWSTGKGNVFKGTSSRLIG